MEDNPDLSTRDHPRSPHFSGIGISSFRILPFICSLFFLLQVAQAGSGTEVTCPWYNDQTVLDELRNGCVCAKNPPSSNLLSVQCHDVDGHQLVELLSDTMAKQGISIGLLYLNASFITDDKGQVPEKIFQKLKLVSFLKIYCFLRDTYIQDHITAFSKFIGQSPAFQLHDTLHSF